MRRAVSILRASLVATIFAHMACSGSVSCGGCAGNTLQPIPGGFDPAAQIERAAQVRVTNRGFDQIEQSFTDLLTAYVSMECGAPDSVPCPTDFEVVQGGAANPSSCDVLEDVCIEQVSGEPGPLVGFEIERNEQSGAIVCRDELSDPNRRRCYAWLRFEGLALAPQSPNVIEATLTA